MILRYFFTLLAFTYLINCSAYSSKDNLSEQHRHLFQRESGLLPNFSVGGLLDSGLNGTVRRNKGYFVNISLLLAVILNVYSLPACWINNFFVSPSSCLLETFSGDRLRRVTFFWTCSFIKNANETYLFKQQLKP